MSDTDVRWRAKKVIQDQSNRLVTDTQIKRWDSKTDPGHTHTKTDITDFPSSMPASDVKAWAKADNKPSYVWNEIGNKPTEFNPSSHKHLKNDITDFPESIKNPLSMSIMLNGGNTEGKDLFTYDGSVAKTVNINYLNIGAAPKEHYHDDRYYTEEETDKLIKGVSTGVFENLTWEKILNKPTVFTPANHTHSKSEINDFPDSLKNPSSITIKLNGGTIEGNNVFTYDGSIAKTIDITAADIGASSIGHLHTVKDIKDFPISMPASDVYDWAKEKFKPSYVWNEIGEKPTEFNPIAHKHVVNEITDFPETMRNPYSISIRLNNGTTEDLDLFTYNGDGEKSINITPIKIDAADRVHTHTRSQITDFPETLRNPAFLTVKFDNMANKSVTSDSYDGSVPKTITVASNIHKHLKEDILDFPDSIKNPKNITLILDNGETTTQDFYDGSEAKTFNVASAKHTHSKIDFTDFPVSIKNPFSVTIVTNDGKTTSSDSYDGSIAKTFNLASAKHVHVKSEITDFPDSIKNPSAITIVTNNGETTSKDTYDGSLSKTFELASAKHVHVKSEITDFPSSIKNPTAITITMNDGTDITKDSYDGSEEKTFDVAKGKHVHVKSEITDFPDSIKNPTAITIITNDGKDISQDSYDGSEGKIFEVADAKHVHVKSEITDFPDSIKNPTAITISLNDGKTTVSDSYDGSKEKTFNAASAKHVHVKSEITDFPSSIKNPASITIAVDDGVTKTQDSYDGSSAKKFDVANAKHVHVKSEITDFPTSIKNPNTLIVNINDGKTSTQTKYDGSVIAKINVASAKHVHVKSEITDFPESIKNPTAITISTYNGTDTVSDSYDGSTTKTFNVASANHTHSKFNIVDFPDSIKNPTTLIINMNDGKNITTDSYDGSEEKTLNLASAKHVHVKSEITDFPASIKNPTAITITMNDGKTIVSDSYDGSSAKKFDVAKGKHVHVKSEITDFPASIKNPTAITITMNDGKNTTTDSYDGSSAKTFDVAKGKHVHVKSEITDFPTSIKNPTAITISLNDGKNTTTDSYDGSKEKTFNAASAKHVHVKSEITDFPSSIKNPTAITISLNDGKNITKDSYDGSTAKSFDVAKGKHVHVKSEITDFPSSIKNPTSLSIQLNGGAATVYDGSSAKSINITPAGIGASANTHLHDDRYYTESEIDTKLSNVNTTLTSHNHTELAGVASSQAVPGKSKDGFMTYHYNVNNGLTNNMPSSNNANAILTISRHAGDYTTQLGFSSDDNIYYRNGVGTTSWKRILDSSNYNNYAPSKTGSGASGTWSINITGKANTAGIADSANAVAWGNVSGKPSTYTPSAHTHTKSQITDFPASLKNPTSLSIQLNGGTATVYDGSTAKSINITPAGIGASASGHTHNYAGSSSVGGSANSAVKLDTSTAGSATQPVYFSGGKPVACTYSLNKSVPSNAVFTDTNTWRGIQNNLTSDSTNDSLSAAQGKVLKGLVDGKAAASHTHTKSQITDFPTSMPASDVYSWAKASTKPNYSKSEVGLGNVDNTADKNKSVSYANSAGTASYVPNSGEGTGNMARHVWFSNTNPETSRVYSDKFQYNPATDVLTVGSITGSAGSVAWGNVSGRPSSLPASDVYAWAKAKSKPSYSWSEIGSKPSTFTPSSHNHDYLTLYSGRPTNINFNKSTNGAGAMFHFVATSSTTTGKPPEDSNVLQLNWDNDGGYDSQLSITNCDGHMYFRGQSAGNWNNWKTVIDSSNIGSQSVNYANSAGGVAWGNVSGKPSTFTPSSHTHTKSQIKDFPSSLPASDVYSWAKASSKPSYAWSEITSKPSTFTPSSHTHTKSQVGLGNVDNTADSAKSVKYATSAGNANALNWVAGNEIKFTKPNYTTEQDLHFCWSWADNSKVKLIKQYIFDGGDGNPTQVKASQFNGPLNGNASSASSVPWSGVTGKPSTFTPSSHTHNFVVGSYTGNGGQQKPNYFGTDKVGFLMMNTTVNGNSQYKDWVIMDCYSGTDVGGGVAIGVNRQSLGAYIMRSDTTRTAWAESAELLHTKNYTSYTVTKSGGGASGTWGINISGKASTAGTADSANSVAWGNVSGKPSTFTPSNHTHTKSQITDFGTHVYDATISRDANTVLAAPNGSSGVATFRKLVAADIPSLTKSKISDFPTSMPASDVYSWAKASSKPSYSWSEIGSKPSTFTPSSHTHNTIQDINNNQNVTFAYSKAGMDYGDYTWLAAWNGEELRTVAKGQFATASHTHSYVPLSGGTITGNILPSKNNSYYLGKENSAFYQITGQNIYAQYLKPINNTSTIGVYTDPWNAGHFESLRSGTISCSKVSFFPSGQNKTLFPDTYLSMNCLNNSSDSKSYGIINFYYDKNIVSLQPTIGSNARSIFLPNASGTLQISSSDIRLKDNVKDSNINALEFINKIKIRQFDWKESGKGHQDIGFIADELEELDSNLSVGGGTDISEYKNENGKCIKKEIMNVKCVNTFYLQGYEVKAIQELSSKVDNKVDALEKENNKLKDIINQLFEKVTRLENK